MQLRTAIQCLTLYSTLIGLAAIGLCSCSNKAGDSAIATEQRITQDISAVRGRSATTLPVDERLGQRPADREPSGPAPVGAHAPFASSGSAGIHQTPHRGHPQTGYDFAIGTCTPCHVVSPDQKSPIRFADAPDFRSIANAPGTTAIGLNIWLTNPHPTMPKLVLYPQEAADVIAYILSLRERR